MNPGQQRATAQLLELCAKAENEHDPVRLLCLTEEINRLLEEDDTAKAGYNRLQN